LFAIYLSEFSAISKIYGPYAFILVLLVWIYYSSIIFVFGGIVGQVYWERRKLRETGRLERWL
jgi:membrane protein